MSAKVPMLDLGPEIEELWPELQAALESVLRSTRFILGPNVQAFEREAAEYLGVRHSVALNSGTDALVLGLRALGVGPGDQVITTAFTFVATAEAICRVGAEPVFVDIEPRSFNMDPARLEERLAKDRERVRAVVPVHLFGHPADIDAIRGVCDPLGIPVFEDTAQAFGATWRGGRAGALGGRASAFSFFPSKNLGAYGDGGLFATDDDELAEAVVALRNHGARDKYRAESIGYNSRLDEFQAAVLRIKLPRVDAWNEARRAVARRYSAALDGVDWIDTPGEAEGALHVYHQYTLRVRDGRRDPLEEKLADAGIASAAYYRVPLHRLEPFASDDPLPETDRAAEEVLSLPIGAHQPEAVTARVLEVIVRPL